MPPAKRGSIASTIRSTPGRKAGTPSSVKSTLTNGEDPKLNRRTTVYLKEETWKSMKLMTIETGESVSAYIERLIEKDVKRVQKKQQ